MMTVRFANGFSVQYNTANYVSRSAHGYADLYTKKDGTWVAQVPNTALIEAVPCCRTYHAGHPAVVEQRLEGVEKSLRSIRTKLGKMAKKEVLR